MDGARKGDVALLRSEDLGREKLPVGGLLASIYEKNDERTAQVGPFFALTSKNSSCGLIGRPPIQKIR